MIHENENAVCATERLAPLLSSIATEIKERDRAIRDLETRLDAFDSTRRAHRDEVGRIEATLSTHRRELRLAEKELTRLGWTVEDVVPVRLLHRGASGASDVSFQLFETGFNPRGNGR